MADTAPRDAISQAFRAVRQNATVSLSDQWSVNRLCYELADLALAAMASAGYAVLYMPRDDPEDRPPSDLFDFDEDDVVTPSRTDRQPPDPVAGAKGGQVPDGDADA